MSRLRPETWLHACRPRQKTCPVRGLPLEPSYVGAHLLAPWAILDPAANQLGVHLSGGVDAGVGAGQAAEILRERPAARRRGAVRAAGAPGPARRACAFGGRSGTRERAALPATSGARRGNMRSPS